MKAVRHSAAISENELEEMLGQVREMSGYDFHDYSRASLTRSVLRMMEYDNIGWQEMLDRIRTDGSYLRRFVEGVTVNLTEMFRDPPFYRELVKHVFPVLASQSFIRIWHAGCSTGEEVYSMAIMLHEHGLLDRTRIYATDLNPSVLSVAESGTFPLAGMRQYSRNYLESGGTEDFSAYYSAGNDTAVFEPFLSKRIVFSTHNLATDSSFNLFNLVVCRNVLIYFTRRLQARVFKLFDHSLHEGGFLALGSRETIRYGGLMARYSEVSKEKIWRKNS